MYQPMAPCPACARHVRVRESACPFCAAALPADFAAHVAPDPTGRLSRSAIAALATAVLGAACAREAPATTTAPATSSGGGVVQGPIGTTAPIPPPRVVPVEDAGAGPDDAGAVVAEYGAPAPRFDAGAPVAAYGAPPRMVTPAPGPPDNGGVHSLYGIAPRE
jgi:hypothetical protein